MDNHIFEPIISEALKKRKKFIFISPHLDDAVFSVGSFINTVSKKTKTVIVTVFNKPSPPPYTFSARKCIKLCGFDDPYTYFSVREEEDKNVARKMGVSYIHLGNIDAQWRKKTSPSSVEKLFSHFLPEIIHLYPVFRLNILHSNKISKNEWVIEKVKKEIENLDLEDALIFCPLALSSHIDHFITHTVVNEVIKKPIYWLDYPYHTTVSSEIRFYLNSKNYHEYKFEINKEEKVSLIKTYKSQINTTFNEHFDESMRNESLYFPPQT